MAATICASSNHSPTLPTISLYTVPTKSSIRTLQQSSPSSSSSSISSAKFGLTIEAVVEAVAIANGAAQAANDALSSASAQFDFSFDGYNEFQSEKDGISECCDWGKALAARRRRRRKRRKASEFSEPNSGDNCMEEQFSFSSSHSGYLTPKEEAEFSLYLKEGERLEAARRRIREARDHEPTSSQWAEAVGMKRRCLENTLCRARESRQRITLSYRRLVVSIATSYQGKGLSLQDLIQEGSIGLLRGAERFDPAKGYKLSTYVYWWIKQAIIRAIANKSRIIRLPGSVCEMMAKIAEANTVLSSRLGRLPIYDEIADMIDMDVSSVRLIYERSRPPISADQTLTNHGSMTLQEIVPGPDELTPEKMVNKQLMQKDVEKLLKTLDEREACILRLYFGLNDETPLSFEEIGRLINLSRERVRQINGIALTKLREISTIDNFRLYMV